MALPPFDRAVVLHAPAVLRVCRALLGPQEAEDACSETFLAALAAYPRLPEGSNLRAWLMTIAHHKSVDLLRAGARAPTAAGLSFDLAAAAAPAEPDAGLWAAVRALPPKQRAAVAYHYLADLPYAQVAELLGISIPAARRRAADGIATLRSVYHQEVHP